MTGKVVSQNNQIEGFGIKLNFNNPSFCSWLRGSAWFWFHACCRTLHDCPSYHRLRPEFPAFSRHRPLTRQHSTYLHRAGCGYHKDPKSKHPEQVASVDTDPILGGPIPSQAKIAKQAIKGPPSLAGSFDLYSYSINNVPQTLDGTLQMNKIGRPIRMDHPGRHLGLPGKRPDLYVHRVSGPIRTGTGTSRSPHQTTPPGLDNGVVPAQGPARAINCRCPITTVAPTSLLFGRAETRSID